MELLSVVVPCYNEEEAVPIFYRETLKAVEALKGELEIEFCFIDDGSKDGTLKSIKELCEMDNRVHYVSFSRNFGKKPDCMPVCRLLPEIMWRQWMLICRILRQCFLRCIKLLRSLWMGRNMIVLQRAG